MRVSPSALESVDPVIHPDSNTSVTVRDNFGRRISSTNENSETISYGYYEETSWMTSLSDARQKTTTWVYNDLGQMLTNINPGIPRTKNLFLRRIIMSGTAAPS